ncbi:MAG: hypothetical protein AB7F39_06740 [Variibacter sp.]
MSAGVGRRAFMRLAALSPFAARQAAAGAAAEMAGIALSPGVGSILSGDTAPRGQGAGPVNRAFDYDKAVGLVLELPAYRDKLTSLLYEENRVVNRIDPDLAVLKSFSLAAKIAFQRQRDVERQLAYQYGGKLTPWGRIQKLISRAAGLDYP